MSLKRPASESHEEESAPKRLKLSPATLPAGDPLRLLTTAYLTSERRLDGQEPVPTDILDLVFEYLVPTALQRLAKNPPASFLEAIPGTDKKRMSTDLYDAAWEVFHHFATGTNKECTPFPHKTMIREDFHRAWATRYLDKAKCDENVDVYLKWYGIPHWFERTEIPFDGYCEVLANDATKKESKMASTLQRYAAMLYPD